MTDTKFVESILVTLAAIGFIGLLVGLMAIITVLRQRRIDQDERAITPPAAPVKAAIKPAPAPKLERTPPAAKTEEGPKPAPVAQVAQQNGTADPVSFQILPDNQPTREEQNIRRLIGYLKSEANKTSEPAQSK